MSSLAAAGGGAGCSALPPFVPKLPTSFPAPYPLQTPEARADMFVRLSSSRPQCPLAAFAGGALPHTMLSSAMRSELLAMFSTRSALPLRAVCKEFRAAVAEHAWDDLATRVHGSLQDWRACFPRARAANVAQQHRSHNPFGRLAPLVDADFVHLAGLRRLDMSSCTSVTDAAFAHLAGMQSLNMSWCSQPALTDAAFAHLRGIQSLVMCGCSQPTITSAAFAHLAGIQSLNMSECSQASITGAIFPHLAGVRELHLRKCPQLASAGTRDFAHLEGVETLNLLHTALTNEHLACVPGVRVLTLSGDSYTDFSALTGQCVRLWLHECSLATVATARADFERQLLSDPLIIGGPAVPKEAPRVRPGSA